MRRIGDFQPCDVHSNVLLGQRPGQQHIFEHTIVRTALNAQQQRNRTAAGAQLDWFVLYRNCAPGATKAARPLWPRPRWIPLHLRPYAASWLVMSYAGRQGAAAAAATAGVDAWAMKPLRARGLTVIAQLVGERAVRLSPAPTTAGTRDDDGADCAQRCAPLVWRLRAGDALVVDADRWRIEVQVQQQQQHKGETTGDPNGNDAVDEVDALLSVSFAAEFEWQY